MIGRHGRIFIFLYIGFLVMLFFMCSTDLIIREPEREIYQIAVIIEDVKGDNYSNFRRGMDQAAEEFNVDVRFITLYEKLDVEQQMELMDREQQDGVDALIVVPADEEQVSGKRMQVPVVYLRPGLERAGMGSITVDYEKMGEQLARAVEKDTGEKSTVLLLANQTKQSDMDDLFLKGAGTALASDGYRVQKVAISEDKEVRDSLEVQSARQSGKTVIIAGNQEILMEAAEILSDDSGAADNITRLYGRGSNVPILNNLDRGYINGVCVTDDFSIGYLSVNAAVQLLEGENSVYTAMDSYYIEKEDLRNPDYEKILFPIE